MRRLKATWWEGNRGGRLEGWSLCCLSLYLWVDRLTLWAKGLPACRSGRISSPITEKVPTPGVSIDQEWYYTRVSPGARYQTAISCLLYSSQARQTWVQSPSPPLTCDFRQNLPLILFPLLRAAE